MSSSGRKSVNQESRKWEYVCVRKVGFRQSVIKLQAAEYVKPSVETRFPALSKSVYSRPSELFYLSFIVNTWE